MQAEKNGHQCFAEEIKKRYHVFSGWFSLGYLRAGQGVLRLRYTLAGIPS